MIMGTRVGGSQAHPTCPSFQVLISLPRILSPSGKPRAGSPIPSWGQQSLPFRPSLGF